MAVNGDRVPYGEHVWCDGTYPTTQLFLMKSRHRYSSLQHNPTPLYYTLQCPPVAAKLLLSSSTPPSSFSSLPQLLALLSLTPWETQPYHLILFLVILLQLCGCEKEGMKGGNEERRWDETKGGDEMRSDEMRSDEMKGGDEIRWDQIRSDEMKGGGDEMRWDKMRWREEEMR